MPTTSAKWSVCCSRPESHLHIAVASISPSKRGIRVYNGGLIAQMVCFVVRGVYLANVGSYQVAIVRVRSIVQDGSTLPSGVIDPSLLPRSLNARWSDA